MRKPSEDLFQIIRSLNKGEKRNFRLWAARLAGDKKYLALFRYIEKYAPQTEAELKAELKTGIYGGQFSVAKNYLFRLILKSLVYYENRSGKSLVLLSEQARILIEKELYPQALKVLQKAKAQAEAGEMFFELHKLLQLELNVTISNNYQIQPRTKLLEIYEAQTSCLQHINTLAVYGQLRIQLYQVLDEINYYKLTENLKSFSHIIKHPMMKRIPEPSSTRAQIWRHAIWFTIHLYSQNYKNSRAFAGLVVDIYDVNPRLRKEEIIHYLDSLKNLGAICMITRDYSAASRVMKKLAAFKPPTLQSRTAKFERLCQLKLIMNIHTGNGAEGKGIEQSFFDAVEKEKMVLSKNNELIIKYLLAYQALFFSDPQRALYWINSFISGAKSMAIQEWVCYAKVLNLMIHYDLGNFEYVVHEIPNTQRFLRKRQHFFEFEKGVLRNLRRLLTKPNPSKPEEGKWKQFNMEMIEILKGKGKNAEERIDIQSWIESKLSGKPMWEIRQAIIHEEIVKKEKEK